MSAHTPGPWDAEITMGEEPLVTTISYGPRVTVARVCGAAFSSGEAESANNARLIAAAPEMLRALRDITDLFEINVIRMGPRFPRGADALQAARAVIAKAEGKP